MPATKKDPMKFEYFAGEQRSPEWFKLRLGRVTASRLGDWLAVSKAKATLGKPLKPRQDYEKELVFERQFGTSFTRFTTDAMQAGIDFEDFMVEQYERITGNKVQKMGAWYNEFCVISPDGGIMDGDKSLDAFNLAGGVEIKVLGDNSFTDVLSNGVPPKYWMQVQAALWASGTPWWDFVAGNLSTRKVKIIRVTPDTEFHEWLALAIPEPITAEQFDMNNVHDFVSDPPAEGEQDNKEAGSAVNNLKGLGF